MTKPRILIIENSIALTGALKAIANVTLYLKSEYNFFYVLPKESLASAWIKKFDFEFSEWKIWEISKRSISWIAYFPYLIINAVKLNRIVKEKTINLIHVNDLYNLIPVAARLLGCRTPYVCHVRFMPEVFPKVLFDFWLRIHLHFSKKIIVVSEALLRKLPTHQKIELIYDGFPFKSEEMIDDAKKVDSNSYIFLYLANMISGKGQNYALEAFAKVHEQLPAWRLRFVGGDMGLRKNQEYLIRLKEDAENLGVSDKIDWFGFTDSVEREYKQADIVLNFSEAESFSMTSLESLSYERALIVSNCGGPTEIVKHEKTGLIVENKNVEAMADAMIRLASSSALRMQLAVNGNKFVREKFNILVTADKLKVIYQSCMS